MAATHEDRNAQLSPGVAIKAPCRLATTANITLNGEQTIDGIAAVSGDRVFVKNQTDTTANGIYAVSTGSWTREPDFDGTRDAVEGTIISVNQGATNSDTMWRVTNTGTIVFGTTMLTFERALVNDSATITFLQSGTGAVARPVQDYLRGLEVAIEDFGANTVPGTTDCSAFLQLAINKVALAGGGTVKCMNPPYLIAMASGNTVTLPVSGSTMPYCVELKPKILIKGPGRERITFSGDHIYRTTPINTSQKIMFRLTDAPTGATFPCFEDVQINGCMIPVYHSGIINGYMRRVAFGGCALPMICQQAERFTWEDIDFGTPAAGVMIGGWLISGGSTDSGGWADKCSFIRFNYNRLLVGWTQTEIDVDAFFNAHFFNNAGLAAQVPYRGVIGISIFAVARRNRGCFGNSFLGPFFHYGSPRPFLFGGPEHAWNFAGPLFSEHSGYTDSTLASIMGVGTVDPWNATRMKAVLDIIVGSATTTIIGASVNDTAAIDVITPGIGSSFAIDASASANVDLTNPKTNGDIRTATFSNQMAMKRVVQTYSAAMTLNFKLGNEFDITVTDGVAFSIAYATADLIDGQRVTITVRNTFGAMGVITWDAGFKMSAWTNPANGFSRSIDFKFNGVNLVQVGQTGVDIPN